MNTNGNASYVSSHVSVEKSERADIPRNRFVAGDFDGVGLNFWRPWGVPLHSGELGDLDHNVLFLSVNLMGEVGCCFLKELCGEAMTSRRPGHLTHERGISGAFFRLPSFRSFFRDLETLMVRCVFLFAISENKTILESYLRCVFCISFPCMCGLYHYVQPACSLSFIKPPSVVNVRNRSPLVVIC